MKIRGYFAIFGNQDSYGTIFDEGAFSEWIRGNPDTQLPIYWNHDHRMMNLDAMPVGVTTAIREDSTGVYFEGTLLDTPRGREVAEAIRSGAVKQTSFAFRNAKIQDEKDAIHIRSADPVEVSVMAINAANTRAWVAPDPKQGENENE